MASTTQRHPAARVDTRSIGIDASAEEVYDFVSTPEHLPLWAVGFCRSIERDDLNPDRWLVTSAHGQVPIQFVVDRSLGVVDFHLFPDGGPTSVAHSRVTPNGDGATYVFTQTQAPGMSDNVFDAQITALVEELEVLRRVMAARAACRV